MYRSLIQAQGPTGFPSHGCKEVNHIKSEIMSELSRKYSFEDFCYKADLVQILKLEQLKIWPGIEVLV